jgi:hypothetical protein
MATMAILAPFFFLFSLVPHSKVAAAGVGRKRGWYFQMEIFLGPKAAIPWTGDRGQGHTEDMVRGQGCKRRDPEMSRVHSTIPIFSRPRARALKN